MRTLEAYAWALYASGKPAAAKRQIETAIAVGIRDAGIYYRAGVIAAKLGERNVAFRYLQRAVEISSQSEHASAARRLLSRRALGVNA